jgi:hypothetical protein
MAIGFPVKANYVTGEVLTATNMNDLSGSVNLLTSAQYAAGKNKIINGDYYVNQRNFTSTTTTGTYMFDRWITAIGGDGTSTYTSQTFTPGTAPVSGYEGKSYQRIVTTGQTNASVATITYQPIEDVRTYAGQTVTYSFWAKASSGTPKIALSYDQNFGTGGSADVTAYISQVTLSTSWARYSVSFAVPSISGKTIGSTTGWLGILLWVSAGSSSNSITNSLGIQTNTFELWGHQLEEGSTASDFQTATGTIQGELAACQRYLPAFNSNSSGATISGGYFANSTNFRGIYNYQVQPRVAPTGVTISNTAHFSATDGGADYVSTNLTFGTATLQAATLNCAISGATISRAGMLFANNASAQILFTGCEL